MSVARPENIDDYLAGLSADKRAALEKLRKAIRAAAPQADECISYGLPAFRDAGGLIAGFGAGKQHCSYYPMSGSVIASLSEVLDGYDTSKGAIRFDPARPLPAALIRKLVKARQAENAAAAPPAARKSRPKAAFRPAKQTAKAARPAAPPDVDAVLRELEENASAQYRLDMASRYGIVTGRPVLGTPMAKLRKIAKALGQDHDLAASLWATGVHDARMLAALADEPERVTAAQMDRWVKDADNWALVDTLCFSLFDRTPHIFAKVEKWSKSRDEFVKRAAFALLASAAQHGRGQDEDYLRAMPLIEDAACDGRNFVKKGVSWALRAIGGKRSPALRAAARALAEKLAASGDPAARWVGRDALRAFAKKA